MTQVFTTWLGGLLLILSLCALWTPSPAVSAPSATPTTTVLAGLIQANADTTETEDATEADTTETDDGYRARTDRPGDIRPIAMDEVVVTATKTMTAQGQQAVPTTVISGTEIEEQGAARLSDVLANQPGMTLNYDHGAGVQIQGLGSDYTMILMDGQPLIGRTAGTLDLERLSVRNVERVEIVRGPSSSLYGNEALAGVVNLVTQPTPTGSQHPFARGTARIKRLMLPLTSTMAERLMPRCRSSAMRRAATTSFPQPSRRQSRPSPTTRGGRASPQISPPPPRSACGGAAPSAHRSSKPLCPTSPRPWTSRRRVPTGA